LARSERNVSLRGWVADGEQIAVKCMALVAETPPHATFAAPDESTGLIDRPDS